MDLQARARAAADVAPLPAGQPGLRLTGDRPGARAAAGGLLSDAPPRRAALAWLAVAAAIALGQAIDAGVAGPGAVPAVARTAVACLALFAVCGYGPARLLAPATLRPRVGLLVLPVGAACSTLALTVLGLLHVPLVGS